MTHSVLYTAQAFHDLLLQKPFSQTTQYHLGKTLYYLQQHLGDKSNATSDSTLSVVVSLATAAVFLGDMHTLAKHMDGLYQMVQIRGGVDTLGHGTMLEHKAQR